MWAHWGTALAATMVLCFATGASQALTISSTFTATGFVDSTNTPVAAPEDPVSGSYSLSVDDSLISGVGMEDFLATVVSIDLNIAGTVYGVGDVGAAIGLVDGVVSVVFLGTTVPAPPALPDLTSCLYGPGTTDFCLTDRTSSVPDSFVYGTPGTSTLYYASDVAVSAAVPEPAAALVFGVGLSVIAAAKRRRD